jgi:tetratricopeptide (TPR) repeat protein
MKKSNKKPDTAHQRTFFSEIDAGRRKWILYCIGVGVVASLLTLIVTYFFITAGLNKAQENLDSCQHLLDEDNFFEAEQECAQAQEFLSTVRLVGQGKKEQMSREVRELLGSPKLQQGLLGNIMVDGKFVSLPAKELILAFKKAKTNGDIFFEQKSWLEAEVNYQRAMEVASKTTEIDQLFLAHLYKKLSRTQFNILVQNGEKSLVISDWKPALVYFDEALLLAKGDPHILPGDMVQLTLLINRTEFASLLDQGHAFFDRSDWNSALKSYEKALKVGNKLHSSQSESITGLLEDIARTKIYMTIENGKNAFAKAQWDDAIRQYEKAIVLLTENSRILSKSKTKKSSEKLSRIMLQTTIIRDKQKVVKHLKSDEYEAALIKLQAIQKAIDDSSSGDLPEFQTTRKDITQKINDVRDQLLIANQTAYLTNNFQRLFRKHYPEADLSVLSSPKVKYLEKIGNRLLFRIQCTEDTGGRPLRLQIDYIYSPATDHWQLYGK